MLQATKLLLETATGQQLVPLLNVISRHGGLEDSQALYARFVQTGDPALLAPIMRHGDAQLAADLFRTTFREGKVQAPYPPDVLLALSYLGHPQTEHLLFDYYTQLHQQDLDWELHRAVCLALLNYPCKGYEDTIIRETEKCLSASLFPEFIPVLAAKTGNLALADRMYDHGGTMASSDSNAGLILGIALFGQACRERFKSILWNPDWEAASSATGNRAYTLMGMNYLGISFQELFQDLKSTLKREHPFAETLVLDFLSLLSMNLHAPERYPVRQISTGKAAARELYRTLFSEQEGGAEDTLSDLLAGYAKRHRLDWGFVNQEASLLQDSYEKEASRELELSCYRPIKC